MNRYLIWATPVVLATMVWGSLQSEEEIRQSGSFAFRALWEVMSWSLILWFALLLVFMILLAVRKQTQESTIKYLAGLKERDEREEIIMGLAAKRSFTATIGLLIALLFLSCFTISITKLPEDRVADGKRGTLNIGFRFTGTDTPRTTSPDGAVLYEHHDLPLSKSALILLILIWQLATFRVQARREF